MSTPEDVEVLLVEDNPNDVELTLQAAGKVLAPYKVVVTRDGAEAVDYLLGRGAYSARDVRKLPVMVLLDINLPKLNGFEVLKRLREHNKGLDRTLWVVVSTSMEPKDMQAAKTLGAAKYLRKPANKAESAEFARQLDALLRNAAGL